MHDRDVCAKIRGLAFFGSNVHFALRGFVHDLRPNIWIRSAQYDKSGFAPCGARYKTGWNTFRRRPDFDLSSVTTFAQNHDMSNFLKSLFGEAKNRIKIFEGMDTPMPNFKIVAQRVRVGKTPKTYILDDDSKLKSIVEKWQFEPGGQIERCGYDYKILFTNGEVEIPINICFFCKTMSCNQKNYKISRWQIMRLLCQDFKLQ
ncbi:MAG: hypothetical protein ABMA02_02190 [Saprospiraceae bacterium]